MTGPSAAVNRAPPGPAPRRGRRDLRNRIPHIAVWRCRPCRLGLCTTRPPAAKKPPGSASVLRWDYACGAALLPSSLAFHAALRPQPGGAAGGWNTEAGCRAGRQHSAAAPRRPEGGATQEGQGRAARRRAGCGPWAASGSPLRCLLPTTSLPAWLRPGRSRARRAVRDAPWGRPRRTGIARPGRALTNMSPPRQALSPLRRPFPSPRRTGGGGAGEAPPPPRRTAQWPLRRPARHLPAAIISLICRTLTLQAYMADRPFRWYPTRTHRTRYVVYSGRHDGSSDIFELIRERSCRTAGPSLSILDVGCSTGVAAAYLKEKLLEAGLKVSVSGIDPAPEVFKDARRNLDRFYEGSIGDARIEEKFDIVLCARLLRFAFPREQKRLVRACAECCAPGGVLVIDGVPVTMRNTYHMVSAARADEYGDLLVSAWNGLGWRSRQGRAVPLRLKRSHRSAEHSAKCALGDPVGSAQAALGAIRRVLGP